jgi:hypothetical protein
VPTEPTKAPAEYAGLQNGKPFRWRPNTKPQSTAAERETAVCHITSMLETGLVTLRQILWYMDPRINEDTLLDWRHNYPDIGKRIDTAFEVGQDNADERRYLVAINAPGHKFSTERAKLVTNVIEKRLAIMSARHRPKTVISNDPDAPFLPAQFIVQPVEPAQQPDDELPHKPIDVLEDED